MGNMKTGNITSLKKSDLILVLQQVDYLFSIL